MSRLEEWLKSSSFSEFDLKNSLGDASFRKYFVLNSDALVMDSSLELDSLTKFMLVHKKLKDAHIKVPTIFEQDLKQGYLIIQNFGSKHYLDILNRDNFIKLYKDAIAVIAKMQQADAADLPLYDREFLYKEMALAKEWYIEKLLNRSLTKEQNKIFEASLNGIIDVVLSQPQGVFVHRDYHSRNIMLCDDGSLGIIDFQDAMSGALTYDLVSLLKDCYIEFERDDILKLALEFRDMVASGVKDEQFIKWFDFMGLQRHIKVLGVFSRLSIRDKKDGYLKDIPLTLKYTLQAASMYDETKPLANMLESI